MEYTVTNLGNRHVYRAERAIEGEAAPRWATLYNPTTTNPKSAAIETSNGKSAQGLTIDQAAFMARCFVEWDQPAGITFAVVASSPVHPSRPDAYGTPSRPQRFRSEPQPAAYPDEAAYLEALNDYRLP